MRVARIAIRELRADSNDDQKVAPSIPMAAPAELKTARTWPWSCRIDQTLDATMRSQPSPRVSSAGLGCSATSNRGIPSAPHRTPFSSPIPGNRRGFRASVAPPVCVLRSGNPLPGPMPNISRHPRDCPRSRRPKRCSRSTRRGGARPTLGWCVPSLPWELRPTVLPATSNGPGQAYR
jgi:hypothetical protein